MMFFLGEKYSVGFSTTRSKIFTFSCAMEIIKTGLDLWASQVGTHEVIGPCD